MNMAMPKSRPDEPIRLVQPAEAPVAGPLAGDPAMLGLPSFLAGSVALGLAAIGLLAGATTNAALPILLAAASAGLFLATVWSAATGQNAAAGIYGIFGGFYLSYAILLLGLIHNWFGIGLAEIVGTQKVFLITWLVIVTMLVLATLRLPVIYTALFALVDVALLLNLLAVIQVPASTTLVKAAGWVILAFSVVGAYLFFNAAWHATGGKALPTGRAILHA
jgi:uncharacterized protein